MADQKNYFQRRTKDRGPRSNNRIYSPEVQVISSDGENLGVLNTTQAISPMLCGYNDESTPVTIVYAKVRNETASAATITVTLTFVPLEA